jgi:ABC-2 type transport system ATP-binding protein
VIEVTGLTKSFGSLTALRGLSFGVQRGEIFGFVGRNGAGKTTTIRTLATLCRPDAGMVMIDGIDVLRNPDEARARIGYMPDFFGVYEQLTATEYLDFYASCFGISARRARRIVADLLALVHLEDRADSPVESLSRGMQQRLCLARALVHDPSVMLLDEPAAGLDPRARIEMRDLLADLRSMGKTILVSSHILLELAEMCTSIGIIERGRMVAAGSVEQLLGRATERRALIRVLSDRDGAVQRLCSAGMPATPGQTADALEVAYSGDDTVAAALLGRILECGIAVVSFVPTVVTLEDVFLDLTEDSRGKSVA